MTNTLEHLDWTDSADASQRKTGVRGACDTCLKYTLLRWEAGHRCNRCWLGRRRNPADAAWSKPRRGLVNHDLVREMMEGSPLTGMVKHLNHLMTTFKS